MADNKGKGLEGVVAARTSISDIDGQQGKLFYAGYDIADLAEHSTFEETVYLLHHLALPTRAQLDEENAFLRSEQRLDPALVRLISSLGDGTNPMTVLRTVVSAAAALDPTVDDESSEANLRKAYKLVALTPRIVAAFHRLRTGGDAIEPRDDQPLASNFLYSLTGKEPDERLANTHWFEISDQIQQTVMEEKGLYPNVDFYTASVYSALGIPPDLYTTLFATARMAGWTAHIREQYADNRLIRPDSEYIGPGAREWVPIDDRR